MKNKKYHNVGTILKSNTKIVERGKIDTPNTQIHDKIDTPNTQIHDKIDTPNTQIHDKIDNPNTRMHDKIDTPNTQIHDLSLSWLGTCTSIKKK